MNIHTHTHKILLISVQSEQLTRLNQYVTAFLTAARNEHYENATHYLFLLQLSPCKMKEKSCLLVWHFVSLVAFSRFTDLQGILPKLDGL